MGHDLLLVSQLVQDMATPHQRHETAHYLQQGIWVQLIRQFLGKRQDAQKSFTELY